jgi:hypothetical protein
VNGVVSAAQFFDSEIFIKDKKNCATLFGLYSRFFAEQKKTTPSNMTCNLYKSVKSESKQTILTD